MNINKCIKESFVVIGKEGSTNDGAGFIQNLWEDANSHFHEVEQLAKKMIRVILLEYGGQCLISHVLLSRGKMDLQKVCIWPE